MKQFGLIAGVAFAVSVVGAPARAASYTYTLVDVPGATETRLGGINNSGLAVGRYVDGGGVHGFTYLNGTIATFDAPGAYGKTVPLGINDKGQIAGQLTDSTGYHGFIKTGTVFQIFDLPGAQYTTPWGINNSGVTVGTASTPTDPNIAFVYDGVTAQRIVVPNALTGSTGVFGINNAGVVVGNSSDGTNIRPFSDAAGVFTSYTVPGLPFAYGFGNNEFGDIVGDGVSNSAGSNGSTGFVITGGVVTLLNAPGAFASPGFGTIASDINDAGVIVGEDRTRTVTRGFITNATRDVVLVPPTPPAGTAVPEPGTAVVVLTGLAGLLWRRRQT